MGRRKKKQPREANPEKSPYQGNRRCFGEYECTHCERQWSSANSWANTYQQCKKCHAKIMAHTQRPLERPKGNKVQNRKPHPRELCERCKKLGHYCVELKRNKSEAKKN